MRLLPALPGIVPLTFSSFFRFGDHFEWNKVTSCIHNILSGQRWIEHYGEIVIKNVNDDSCYCKVNFIKVTLVGLGALILERPWQSCGLGAQGSWGIFHLPFCASRCAMLGAPCSQPTFLTWIRVKVLPSPLTPLWSVPRAAARGALVTSVIMLQYTVLSEISLTQKAQYCMSPFI